MIAQICSRLGTPLITLAALSLLTSCHPAPKASYMQIITDFTIGTVALQVADTKGHDLRYLTLASKIAPEEPAVWANLGLLELRDGNFSQSAVDLNKAAKMAPQSSQIQELLGLLSTRNGHPDQAIQHYQEAVQLKPDNLQARNSLAMAFDQSGSPGAYQQEQQQLEAILQMQPYSLYAWVKLLFVAAKRNDLLEFRRALSYIQSRSKTFPPEAAEPLQQLIQSAKTERLQRSFLNIRILQNVLKENSSYYLSRFALVGDDNHPGNPLQHFLALPNPSSTPSPPDVSLSYTPKPLAITLPHPEAAGGAWLNGSGTVLTYSANAHYLLTDTGKRLAYPGGSAAVPPGPFNILPVDINFDQKMDFVLAGAGGIRFYQQTAHGDFEDVTSRTHLPGSILYSGYTGAWQADLDADGNMDIVTAPLHGDPVCLQNNGDGTFAPIHPFKGVTDARAFAWANLDNSGNPNACFLDSSGKLTIFTNERSGMFRANPTPNIPGHLAAIAVGDVSSAGELDIAAIDQNGKLFRIQYSQADSAWQTSSIGSWPNPPHDLTPGSARCFVEDLDNNGGSDIAASDSHQSQIWLCDQHWNYNPLSSTIPCGITSVVDTTGDGLMDLVGINAQGQAVSMLAHSTKRYNWEELRPSPDPTEFNPGNSGKGGDRRINSFGIGGDMEMRAGELYTKYPMSGAVIHIGLGTYPHIDVLRILWPNGDTRAEFADSLTPDMQVSAPHRLTGSCPFLYAWNGKEFAFVTDFIWRSPLGLKIDAQDTAGSSQTTDWVKVRGDQLAAQNGGYQLRITADLWETHFFDYLSLMTVDHPAGTEIWVDERFAIPPPKQRVIVTGPLHTVAEAKDDMGNDVSSILNKRDHVYLGSFGLGRYQGVTRDHWVELNLSNAPIHQPLYLICQGWVHPTDSSINVALSRSDYPKPQSLSLWVPNREGKWICVRKNQGFPEGKLKTCLFPLKGIFLPGAPRKIRLRTNLEIYWDAIRWAVAEPQVPVHAQVLPLDSATLGYRGFVKIAAANAYSPELPVSYKPVMTRSEKWRDLVGFYTRYGDVKPLLTKIDDRYVIMNAGDVLRFSFHAPLAPQAGWKRDYIMIGDGWEKDGNYNTAFSRTVLPLPSHAINTYSKPPGALSDDPVYQKHKKDWITYQTRWVEPTDFERGVHP